MTLCESFQIEATRLEYRVQMTETCNGTAHAAFYGRQKVLFGHLCAYGTHLFQSLLTEFSMWSKPDTSFLLKQQMEKASSLYVFYCRYIKKINNHVHLQKPRNAY